ncbi:hypothetical protein AAF712_009767 [Marasmius tenuissimus]|uniref:Uncharacterized protein n=1 Tax=Marasmius tenuissimus TaxID=585030 RepID=A0ABR2ZSR0_9AGAR
MFKPRTRSIIAILTDPSLESHEERVEKRGNQDPGHPTYPLRNVQYKPHATPSDTVLASAIEQTQQADFRIRPTSRIDVSLLIYGRRAGMLLFLGFVQYSKPMYIV